MLGAVAGLASREGVEVVGMEAGPSPTRLQRRSRRADRLASVRAMVIAIDGPAGAGKSTVARAVAERLGFTYLDTGAMYRCVALAVTERGGEPAEVAEAREIELGERVLLDGRDVTEAIRTPRSRGRPRRSAPTSACGWRSCASSRRSSRTATGSRRGATSAPWCARTRT